MKYIQRRARGIFETVDERCPETQTEAQFLQLIKEYRLSDPTATYYLSTRPCSNRVQSQKNPKL